LANPWRRQLLDLLRTRPLTTGALAERIPDLSRYAVMQHLGVLTGAGLVVVERRGRERYNHLNPIPLRRWYERWVAPLADTTASSLLALQRAAEDSEFLQRGETDMTDTTTDATDTVRSVRLKCELRIHAGVERVFHVITEQSASWFPHSYGGQRMQRIVVEPRVGGLHYEDWGDGRGHLYGNVTVYDPPRALSLRGRIMPGTILDTEYRFEQDGGDTVLRVDKVAVGPLTEEEAASIGYYGDIRNFAEAIRALAES
jgi:DNA-binding transcriptional ArsR family regulator/uncharacterized protein YndB with AHSA1/START domain